MKKIIHFKSQVLSKEFSDYYEPEKICPICHTSFDGTYLSAFEFLTERKTVYHSHDIKKLYVLHYCHACEQCFLSLYTKDSGSPYYDEIFTLVGSSPRKEKNIEFEPCIQALSPKFCKIYNQALSAENNGLDDLCGFGYRRALEFLIKDFAVKMYPDKAETIFEMPLSNCINNYIDNRKLRIVASRAVWLGNDHSHYISKHEDKDLNDLKLLVELSRHWIAMELETLEAEIIPKK